MMSDKVIFRIVMAISVLVFLVVLVLQADMVVIFPPGSEKPSWVFFLPRLNAMINGTCSVLLVISLLQIRKGRIAVHKALNITTFVLSALFLVSYIIFHSTGMRTVYGGEGLIRYVYLFILLTHSVLAALVLPLVLLSFSSGLQNNVVRHRKLVRWSFPIWLYVTVTGVIVYLMISPYYTF